MKVRILLVLVLTFLALTVPVLTSVTPFYFPNLAIKGNVTYAGYYNICQKYSATPCTSDKLLVLKFWQYELPLSWIMDATVNCVGYSTSSSMAEGSCVDTNQLGYQVTTCTCDMAIYLCCIKA